MYPNKTLRLLICVITLFITNIAFPQILFLSHDYDEMLYDSHVKSLDEFIQRFNGNELNSFVAQNNPNKVRATRFSLYDYDLVKNINRNDTVPSIYETFVYEVEADSISISVEHPNNWIEAKCCFKWKNANKDLTLKLQLEEDLDKCWRWCVVDIKGLEESGLLDDNGILQISPVDHELNFMGLESLFLNNPQKFVRTRKLGVVIDKLSYFYGLISSGALKYKGCNVVEFHCEQIPGYSFIVKEVNRLKSTNSGWLIVSLTKNNNTKSL